MYAWVGKILFVDLGSSRVTERPTKDYLEKYVGGRGIAARIYYELADPDIGPFDPQNPLIFMTGPLTGARAQAASIMSVVAKSPGAMPESYCYGNIGGYLGAELKKAGFDGVVITGRASHPVYLWIDDGKLEVRDADDLWGGNAFATAAAFKDTHGEKARFVVIGVSGENLVRTATAYASHEGAVSCGFGAVMGSKNLKGMVVRGTGALPAAADPEELKELNKHTVAINKRVHLAIGPDTEATGRGHLLEVVGKGNCHLCGAECIRNVYRYEGRLEGLRHCQTTEYYLPWIYGREDEPFDTYYNAPDLANDWCIDTFELRTMLHWLYACSQAGVLTDEETGLPLAEMGTQRFLERLLEIIARREGAFGDLLAEGLARAAVGDRLSDAAKALMPHGVAPIGEFELEPPRIILMHSLLYQMEPRVHQPLIHDVAFVYAAWTFNQWSPGSTKVTNQVVRDVAKAFWGGEEAGVFNTYDGKALQAKIIQNRVIMEDSLGLCNFTWPIAYSFATPDMVGDPTLEERLFEAVTGHAAEELREASERVANLQRAILIREGRRPEADLPPAYNFSEPVGGSGYHRTAVPGPGDEPVDMTGNVLDRDKYDTMLREYYRLRGWDDKGVPEPATLAALGLETLAPAGGATSE